MTEKKEIHSGDACAAKGEKINEMKENKIIENAKKYDASPKELIPIFPISKKSTHNTQSSRETLFEVKKRLRSLHNMLRTYRNRSLQSRRRKSIGKINEIDEESLSSSVEYLSNTSKTYQCSNNDVTLQNICFNYLPETVSEKTCYILSPESSFGDQNIQIQNKSSVKSSIQNISSKSSIENISSFKSSIRNISSIKSSIQNASSIKNLTIKKCSDIFNEQQGNAIISQNGGQNKMSNNSDGEEKSTVLLLREALHFKKVLLTRVRKKCPIDGIKEDDKFLSELNDPNFPSIIVDVKVEESPTGDLHDKVNQCCIYLDMKQRRDLFPELLEQQINALAHESQKINRENQNYISETPSQYFSITNLADPNDVESNVSLKSPPIYEKVISIVIPVSVEHQEEVDTNEKSMRMKTVMRNIQFEDVILEHIKSIRDYIDTFLHSQNRAISKGRHDILRWLNETSHVVLRNRLTALSNCNSTDQKALDSLNNSSDPSINTGPNYKYEISVKDNILKCYSDMCLRRNPGMRTIKDKFSDKNNKHSTAIELKKKGTDLSLPIILKYQKYQEYKNNSKSAHNLETFNYEKHIVTDIKNSKINKKKRNSRYKYEFAETDTNR